jgi:hypothetical protein
MSDCASAREHYLAFVATLARWKGHAISKIATAGIPRCAYIVGDVVCDRRSQHSSMSFASLRTAWVSLIASDSPASVHAPEAIFRALHVVAAREHVARAVRAS